MEEHAPIDSEAKRESEVIRQVRESEPAPHKSPTLLPSLTPSELEGETPDMDDIPDKSGESVPTDASFSHQANRNSRGLEFWDSFDERYRTPPPPMIRQTVSEDDSAMDMTPSTMPGTASTDFPRPLERPNSRGSTPFTAPHVPALGKRRRDDDLDSNLFKRRAVSPSTSIQSSPVLPSSPVVSHPSSNGWGAPPKSYGPEMSRNGPQMTPRRIGLQGMNETNDGFMNMSIE